MVYEHPLFTKAATLITPKLVESKAHIHPLLVLLAVLGGMWFDSLSANPLGVSILPLAAAGFPIYLRRDLILRGLPFAQFVLGAAASALGPALTLLLLLNSGTVKTA